MPEMRRPPAGAALMGIDLGAGSLKASLVGADGRLIADASRPVTTLSPQPGFSEQDPAEWERALYAAVREVLARSGIAPGRIAAVTFSAGAHTQVLEDAEGRVIRPAILWNDARSRVEVADLRAKADARILEIGANRANATWTLPQMLWVARNEPENHARIARMWLAKDWLRARLTGDFTTDRIDALGTLMLDAAACVWSQELCAMIGFPMSALPPIVEATSLAGPVTAEAARHTGLLAGTPVITGTSDTAAETFGAGMVREGLGVLKLATAATVAVLTPTPRPSFELINYYHVVPDHWYVIAGTNSCASAHRWLRDSFFAHLGEAAYDAMDAAAQGSPVGSRGLLFHPYLNGERTPYWDPLLRADYVGLTFAHGAGDMVRALYEGVAYSLRDCLEAMRGAGLGFSVARLTGGGTRSALWRHIVADVTGVRIEVPATADASYGAALLAGLGIGVFADIADAAKVIEVTEAIDPDPAASARYAEGFRLYKETQAALAGINHKLHSFAGEGA